MLYKKVCRLIMKIQVVYRGVGNFNSTRFSANKVVNKESFEKLLKLKEKIDAKDLETYNPVYIKDLTSQSITVTCKTSLVRLKPSDIGNTYDIEFGIFKKEYESKTYINLELRSVHLVEKVDKGEETSEFDSD